MEDANGSLTQRLAEGRAKRMEQEYAAMEAKTEHMEVQDLSAMDIGRKIRVRLSATLMVEDKLTGLTVEQGYGQNEPRVYLRFANTRHAPTSITGVSTAGLVQDNGWPVVLTEAVTMLDD